MWELSQNSAIADVLSPKAYAPPLTLIHSRFYKLFVLFPILFSSHSISAQPHRNALFYWKGVCLSCHAIKLVKMLYRKQKKKPHFFCAENVGRRWPSLNTVAANFELKVVSNRRSCHTSCHTSGEFAHRLPSHLWNTVISPGLRHDSFPPLDRKAPQLSNSQLWLPCFVLFF